MIEFKASGLLKNKPDNLSEKQNVYYDILSNLGIEYERVEYNKVLNSMEDHRVIDEILETKGIKNLVFRTMSKQNPRYFFIITYRDVRFDTHAFRNKYKIPKIHMANEEQLKELLGTVYGAVSIIELIHDPDHKIELFIDPGILKETYFRMHLNDEYSIIRIKMNDFKNKLVPYLKHEMKYI